uniref:Uncharacterized protein n=1 Tax=Magallana gigas TaxID=29159 RepID=K1QXK6_MAGGI
MKLNLENGYIPCLFRSKELLASPVTKLMTMQTISGHWLARECTHAPVVAKSLTCDPLKEDLEQKKN